MAAHSIAALDETISSTPDYEVNLHEAQKLVAVAHTQVETDRDEQAFSDLDQYLTKVVRLKKFQVISAETDRVNDSVALLMGQAGLSAPRKPRSREGTLADFDVMRSSINSQKDQVMRELK